MRVAFWHGSSGQMLYEDNLDIIPVEGHQIVFPSKHLVVVKLVEWRLEFDPGNSVAICHVEDVL